MEMLSHGIPRFSLLITWLPPMHEYLTLYIAFAYLKNSIHEGSGLLVVTHARSQ